MDIQLEVTGIDGRKVNIDAEIRDAVEVVGKAEHRRFVIDVKRHAERLRSKAAKYGAF